jgi:hypothetical protein
MMSETSSVSIAPAERVDPQRRPSQVQGLLALSGAAEALEIAELGDVEPATQALLQIARAGEGA